MGFMSQAVTLINSEVINGNTKPPSTTFTVGIEFYGDFRMMNSEVTGFTYGLENRYWDTADTHIRIFSDNDFSGNTVGK